MQKMNYYFALIDPSYYTTQWAKLATCRFSSGFRKNFLVNASETLRSVISHKTLNFGLQNEG